MAYRRARIRYLEGAPSKIRIYTPILYYSACKPNYLALQSYLLLAQSYNINIENFRLEEPRTRRTGTYAYANILSLLVGLRVVPRSQERR